MGVGMHVKTDSEVTSIDASTPPRSPRRPLYYVQSPSHSHNDLEKMSYGSSPFGSPAHHHFHYHCSPIHHSRESSTSRFSVSLKNPKNAAGGWRLMQRKYSEIDEEEEEDGGDDGEAAGGQLRFYAVCFVLAFVVLFSIFSLILWGASLAYRPRIVVKSISFRDFKIQAGMDPTGVPTDMLTLNSTVAISYRNPATFFGVHVTSTPLELHYLGLKIASGHMNKFYQSRKSQRRVIALVQGHQVPLYGGMPLFVSAKDHLESTSVPLNLTFVMRSRAYILGKLVKTKFYRHVLCAFNFRGNHLGKPLNFTKLESCVYR
ncbi:late embryogenesis abundant protein [Striga asiatica]|uniref:Late embryogenesis abundant protein n=1 Tax=Striga asiatica TaxID=4170 RepID=A0A5A7QYU4_STRAF|nr:late embryogenesis abundant protein [Striga asiatica]